MHQLTLPSPVPFSFSAFPATGRHLCCGPAAAPAHQRGHLSTIDCCSHLDALHPRMTHTLLRLSRHRLASLLRTCSCTHTFMRAPMHYQLTLPSLPSPWQCCALALQSSDPHLPFPLTRNRLASLWRTCSRTSTSMRAPMHCWVLPRS